MALFVHRACRYMGALICIFHLPGIEGHPNSSILLKEMALEEKPVLVKVSGHWKVDSAEQVLH